jgi:hypothetical protein
MLSRSGAADPMQSRTCNGRPSPRQGQRIGSSEGAALDSRPSSALAGYDHVYLPAAAFGADQPLSPIGNGHLSAVPFGLLGGIRFDLMATISAPYHQANAGSRRTA